MNLQISPYKHSSYQITIYLIPGTEILIEAEAEICVSVTTRFLIRRYRSPHKQQIEPHARMSAQSAPFPSHLILPSVSVSNCGFRNWHVDIDSSDNGGVDPASSLDTYPIKINGNNAGFSASRHVM